MAGILDFFKKPETQDIMKGVLGAAVTGFNPLIGVLGAASIGQDRQRFAAEMESEREKLRGQRITNNANEALLNAPGALGRMMAGEEAFVNPVTGEQLSAPDPGAMTPQQEQQSAIIPELARLAPGVTAGGVLGNMMPAPVRRVEKIQILDRLAEENIELTADEKKEFLTSSGKELDEILKGLQIRELVGRMQSTQQEEADAEVAAADSNVDILANLERLADVNDALAGTPLEPGSSFLEQRRSGVGMLRDMASLMGKDEWAAELDQMATNYDTLGKEANQLVAVLTENAQAQGITITRSYQRLLEEASASQSMSAGTNISILKVFLEAARRNAVRQGQPEDVMARYDKLGQRLSGVPLEFDSEEEAQMAFDAGAFKPGTKITVNGVTGSWK